MAESLAVYEKSVTHKSPRVLVVEGEANLRELLCQQLEHEGYECDGVADGREGLQRARDQRFDLLVLDDKMPGLDGASICREVRTGHANRDVPILMLTASSARAASAADSSGPDAYLTKPFAIRDLASRARALVRRGRPAAAVAVPGGQIAAAAIAGAPPITVHGIEIDPARRRVRMEGRDVELTDQEFRLLHLLATHAGIVFSREALLAKIWRGGTFVTVRSVDTLVKRLRRRIEPVAGRPRFLLTVWGVGYKFADLE